MGGELRETALTNEKLSREIDDWEKFVTDHDEILIDLHEIVLQLGLYFFWSHSPLGKGKAMFCAAPYKTRAGAISAIGKSPSL